MLRCPDVGLQQRHLDDTDDPQDVGLSSEDEITGMAEQIGVSRKITTQSSGAPASSRGNAPSPAPEGEPTGDPVPAPQPSLPEGYVKIGPDEVVIRKGILRGIKRGQNWPLEAVYLSTSQLGRPLLVMSHSGWILEAKTMYIVLCAGRISQILGLSTAI